MSHILIVGCGPAGISAALRLAERGQRVTLASAKPPIYHRCAGLPGIDLPEDAAQELRAMGAQSLSGHEVMHALSRKLLQYENDGSLRFLPYHRLLQLAVGGGHCVGGVLLDERAGKLEGVGADAVLLAAGGMHTMFEENRFGCDGLAATLAFQAGAAWRNPDQRNTSGRYPVFEGGLITSWDGETTVPGLYAAGECADGTAVAFPFSQAMATGTAAADYLCETMPGVDALEAGCAVTEAVNRIQQQLDIFRRTRGTRSPAAVERRIRETVRRTMTGGRTARLLQRGLLDIRVMRQQAARGGYDLGEGLYPVLRLPALLQLLEVMLTTAAYRLLRQDGDLTAVLRDGKIGVTAKRSAAVEAAAYMPEPVVESPSEEAADSVRDELIGVGSALQNAAANEFAAQYNVQPRASAKRSKKKADGAAQRVPPPLEEVELTEDTISFQPVKVLQMIAEKEEAEAAAAAAASAMSAPAPAPAAVVPESAPVAGPAAPAAVPAAAPVPVESTPAPAAAVSEAAPDGTALPSAIPGAVGAAVVTGVELVMDPTPDTVEEPAAPARTEKTVAASAGVSMSPVHASEGVLDYNPLERPGAAAEPVEPPARKRRMETFTPDPEALLALASARKAQAQRSAPSPGPVSSRPEHPYAAFEPDPEALLTVSREE